MHVPPLRLARLAAAMLTSFALLALGACGDASSTGDGTGETPSATPSAPASGSLDGRTFLSQVVTENGAPKALASASVVSLSFADGTLRAGAGCNTMSGPYRLDDGGALVLEELATTEMGCAPELMAQDEWLAGLLRGRPTLEVRDQTLTLRSATTEIVFADRAVAEPSPALEATTWTLDSIIDGETASSVPAGMVVTVRIEGGQLALRGACNSGGASLRIDGEVLRVDPVMMTQMACAEVERMDIDRTIATVLEANPGFRIDGHNLHLDAGAAGGLVFRG